MRATFALFALMLLTECRSVTPTSPMHPLILTSDFGLRDGSVSALKGVAYGVDERLIVSDLSHEIAPFDIWQAALRLQQTFRYWPAGTVFVTVVDPGAGSARRAIALRTKSGHVFVGPDNGYASLVVDDAGLESARTFDEKIAPAGLTGRDLYAYVGAQLASGHWTFAQLGSEATVPPVHLDYQRATSSSGIIQGIIPVLDATYGNVWTNVPKTMVQSTFPAARELRVYVAYRGKKTFEGKLSLATTYSAVPIGQPVLYFNSVMNLALAVNQGNFARLHQIGSGPEWTITISKP